MSNKTNKNISLSGLICFFLCLNACAKSAKVLPKVSGSKHSIAQKTEQRSFQLADKSLTKETKNAYKKEMAEIKKTDLPRNMTFDNLKRLVELSMNLGEYDEALDYIKHAFNNTKDSAERQRLKLAQADIHFERHSYRNAEETYGEFCQLYPGAKKVSEYALYKQTVSQYLLTLKSDQDQTYTRNTLKLVDAYQAKGKAYTTYTPDIREMQRHCNVLLYEHEKGIFEFYFKKKSFKAAEGRLAGMKKEFTRKLASVEPELLQLEYRLAVVQKDTPRKERVLALLENKFPEKSPTRLAHSGKSKKKNYATRF